MDKCNWIDADTIIVSACMAAQHNYMVYKNNKPIEPTKSRLQWTKDYPDKNPNEYTFVREATLKDNGSQPIISVCMDIVVAAIRKIEAKYPDYKAWVCIEGSGNFREDLYPNYKGNREGSILLRKELSRWVVDHFPRVKVSFGCETDDTVAKWMWKGYQDFLKTGEYSHMATSCDKDARTVAGKLYNSCKDVELFIDELEADRWFCTQLLMGDSVDNIKGINGSLSKSITDLYEVRANSRGVGEKTAIGIMRHATSSKECFEIVMECYKDVHEDNWLPALQQEAIALRMQHFKGELYSISLHMEKLGINYV
ncbi:MAG: hypothetical protein GY804_00075 [Alphaproteobacteria bacterium]|nr:hypothetical protein [Alphaproteobacteria bacterium]